jgi:hypothetical protein
MPRIFAELLGRLLVLRREAPPPRLLMSCSTPSRYLSNTIGCEDLHVLKPEALSQRASKRRLACSFWSSAAS